MNSRGGIQVTAHNLPLLTYLPHIIYTSFLLLVPPKIDRYLGRYLR